MRFPKRAAVLFVSLVAVLSVVAVAQNAAPARRGTSPSPETLVLDELATLEWIEKADVAALREGVIEKMELWPGYSVKKGGEIGNLHRETADLTVKKAKLAAENVAAEQKALAQKELALSVVATNLRLNLHRPGMVSKEEMAKAEAEVKVADAMAHEAVEQRELNKADLNLAEQAADEHTIRAPIDGVVYERLKNPGESVRANEAVVRLGNLDRLRAWSYIPIQYSYSVQVGQVVEIQPRLQGMGGAKLPIEQKKFRGKITFVDPQIQPVAETAVRVYADFENPDHDLRPGLKAVMTIYLGPDAPTPGRGPSVGANTDTRPSPR